jgi:hypothetical protein
MTPCLAIIQDFVDFMIPRAVSCAEKASFRSFNHPFPFISGKYLDVRVCPVHSAEYINTLPVALTCRK